jgi:hypothetical protein
MFDEEYPMEKRIWRIENQDGSAILISVVVLLMLSVIGISAIHNTGTELQIAANNKIHQRNLYMADGAAREPGQKIAVFKRTNPDQLENLTPAWLQDHNTDITDPSAGILAGDYQPAQFVDSTGNTNFAVTDNGVAPGSSLSVSNATNLHAFCVYSVSRQNNAESVVEVGYLERF